MPLIYHFIGEPELAHSVEEGYLRLPSLEKEGFIHCSTRGQVCAVANFIDPYREDLVLLEIEEDLVEPEVKYEDSMGDGRLFPHVFGPLNMSAIVNRYEFEWDGEEGYQLPSQRSA